MVDAKSIYGMGLSSAHVYYVTKWRTTYTQYKLHVEKKWRLGEVNIFENWYRGNALEKMEHIYV